ncbi:LolA family protein [Tautonia plasticadhaerens]|uniref:Uncharacterized protein n=1 Tax=Tautonia plasticadhaerens TaxID=2527974 RepID=A0A518HAP8_9BACT|nr:hypothetical protein [Tautonia plasticadhaerens]QDV37909.1 hypothetical protein ElP_58560 [Tautonia plasticadhaerens]
MSNLRIVLALLVAGTLPLSAPAQDPTQNPSLSPPPPAAEPPTEAELTLDEAMEKLRALEKVQATIRQDVEMLGQNFSVEGQFSQEGRYRFSLDLQVVGLPQARGRMRQVSDGKVLWDVSQILDQTYYYQLGLTELLARIEGEPFEVFHRNYFIQQKLGLTGPHWLLDGLRQSVKFDRRLEGEWEGRPVWIVRGNWKDTNALGIGPMAQAPAYIPTVVEVQVDKETGWPYQVLLLGKKRAIVRGGGTPRVDPATGRPAGAVLADEEPPSRFLLTYSDVDFDPDFGPGEFAFRVPDTDRDRVQDRTPDLMAQLDQMARLIEAQKLQDASAAGSAGSILDEVIEVPTPDADPAAPPATLPPSGN